MPKRKDVPTLRCDAVSSSIIRDYNARIPRDAINMALGQPEAPMPGLTELAMVEAICNKRTGYTQTGGLSELRKRLMSFGHDDGIEGWDSIVTVGATGALYLAFAVLVEQGEEAIVMNPGFGTYREQLKFLGAIPVEVPLTSDFGLDLGKIKRAITEKTRVIVINSPSNPTGRVIPRDQLDDLVAIVKPRGIWIVSDEIYAQLSWDKFESMFGLYDRAVIIGGASKAYSMTGSRQGYALAPDWVIEGMTKLQEATTVCAPIMGQVAWYHSLDGVDLSERVEALRNLSLHAYFRLKEAGVKIVQPGGTIYAFPKVPKGHSGEELAEICLANGLGIIPGRAFGAPNHVRITVDKPIKILDAGLDILIKSIEELKEA